MGPHENIRLPTEPDVSNLHEHRHAALWDFFGPGVARYRQACPSIGTISIATLKRRLRCSRRAMMAIFRAWRQWPGHRNMRSELERRGLPAAHSGTANHKTPARCRIKLRGDEAGNAISPLWAAKKSEVAERNHGSKFRSSTTDRPA